MVLHLSEMCTGEDPGTGDTPQPTERPRGLRNDPELLHEIAFQDQGPEVHKYNFGVHEYLVFPKATCHGLGSRKLFLAKAALLEQSTCWSSHRNSPLPRRKRKTQHKQLVKERTALGDLLQEEEVALSIAYTPW